MIYRARGLRLLRQLQVAQCATTALITLNLLLTITTGLWQNQLTQALRRGERLPLAYADRGGRALRLITLGPELSNLLTLADVETLRRCAAVNINNSLR